MPQNCTIHTETKPNGHCTDFAKDTPSEQKSPKKTNTVEQSRNVIYQMGETFLLRWSNKVWRSIGLSFPAVDTGTWNLQTLERDFFSEMRDKRAECTFGRSLKQNKGASETRPVGPISVERLTPRRLHWLLAAALHRVVCDALDRGDHAAMVLQPLVVPPTIQRVSPDVVQVLTRQAREPDGQERKASGS